MSIPSDVFNSTYVPYSFQYSILSDSPFEVYHLGGKGIKDTSEGLLYQVWKLRQDSEGLGDLYLSNASDNFVSEELILTVPYPDRINLCFSSNMDWVVGWLVGSTYTIRYAAPEYVNLVVEGVRSPVLCIDNPRAESSAVRDIFLGYIRTSDNAVCYRLSGEDYAVEHEIGVVLNEHQWLRQIGLNDNFRFQFEVIGAP